MRYADVEKRESVFPVVVSFIILSGLLWLMYFFAGEPGYTNSIHVLANLKSLSENNSFYDLSEPLPYFTLLFWKKITGLNYIPAYLSLMAILYSLAGHLTFLMFQKGKWKLNQFLSLGLIMMIPYMFDAPFHLFGDLIVFNIFLILLLTVKKVSLLSIFIFFVGVVSSFFSSLTASLLYVSIFIIFISLKKSHELKMKTTVFYKKKNIPFILLMLYLALFLFVFLQLGFSNFFSDHGFHDLAFSWYSSFKYFVPLAVLVFISSFLLNEEKELNHSVSTGVILLLIAFLVYYNLGKKDIDLETLKNQRNGVLSLQNRGVIPSGRSIYSEQLFSEYFYFHTGYKIKITGVPDKRDFMVLDGVWAADRKEIERNYKIGDYYKYYQIDNRAVLMNRILLERIIQKKVPAATAMLLKDKSEIHPDRSTGYDTYKQKLIGFFIKP